MDKAAGKSPSQKRYPKELKDRAVRMVAELRREDPGDTSVIGRVARQLGVGTESLRQWMKQAEVDAGTRGGLSPDFVGLPLILDSRDSPTCTFSSHGFEM